MLQFLRTLIPERSPIRLLYHKFQAILAAVWYRFPSKKLTVIAVTGTSGKSTTTELIYELLSKGGKKVGSLSGVGFHFGDEYKPNRTLRTTLRCWTTQKYLRQMVQQGLEYVIIETSSHAIDQNRLWGITVDTSVLTNISENEHLDYHGEFDDYLKTKRKLFEWLNTGYRKPNIEKRSILNRDDDHYEAFAECVADKMWTFSRKQGADIKAEDIQFSPQGIRFMLRVPNNNIEIKTSLIGQHNLENLLCAICVAMAHGIQIQNIADILKKFTGVPGRLEVIEEGQEFAVVVDFSYKPSALKAVLHMLKSMIQGQLIVVWGGAYGRTKENLVECAKILDADADMVVLTTDDPGNDSPKRISGIICDALQRQEGEGFFEIEDRYEAIRYALMSAQENDMVLIAGRGHETTQTIGKQKIHFDDREVSREVLRSFVLQKSQDDLQKNT